MGKLITVDKFRQETTEDYINNRLVSEGYGPVDYDSLQFIVSLFLTGEIKVLD